MVNYLKRRRIAAVIREIQQYQQTPYNLEPIPEILAFAKNIQGVDEAQAYAMALIAEPREQRSES
jgi:son of sevenless-like protein